MGFVGNPCNKNNAKVSAGKFESAVRCVRGTDAKTRSFCDLLISVRGGVSQLDLDNWRRVNRAAVAFLHATDLGPLWLLAECEDIFRSRGR